ncbi:MAG: SUMF1/EgtB/PvdO family nonheme iron enzyme [Verrucomicrobia bacterium]|nr:SUMF1/EgtB/PvdO family nonheme iron enzyme [Verrucomicrobiota bacterium]
MRSLLLLLLLPSLLSAAAPVVSNVRAAQRAGTKLIDVTYDLSDSDSATVFVSIQIYDSSTPLPAFSLSGDVGSGVTPGFNKKITWNAGQDWNRRYTTYGSARIIADDLTTVVPNSTLAYVPAGFPPNGNGSPGSALVFTSGFYMDKTEISKGTWDAVKAWALANGYTFDNPGVGTASNHPVVGVSWYDVVKWCNARSEMEGLAPVYFTDATRATIYRAGQVILRSTYCNFTAPGYRLPTRAEWSKAAWGGSTSGPYPWPSYYGSGAEILDASKGNYSSGTKMHQWDTSAVSNLTANYLTTPCGYYNGAQQVIGVPAATPIRDMANGFGLYDMFGNIGEWLWDSYYSEVTATTEYKDDNYKGPDLGLGDQRYYANQGRGSAASWDSQNKMSPTSVLGTKMYWNGTSIFNDSGVQQPFNLASPVGFRTVRGL